MSKQAVFLNMPSEPPPRNRRVYAAAKMPFAVVAGVLAWAVRPWLYALLVAMTAALVVSGLVNQDAVQTLGFFTVAKQTTQVGAVWTFYLGWVFMAVRLLDDIFR